MTAETAEQFLCDFAYGEHRPLELFVWDRKVGR